jgi:hypothetical protein
VKSERRRGARSAEAHLVGPHSDDSGSAQWTVAFRVQAATWDQEGLWCGLKNWRRMRMLGLFVDAIAGLIGVGAGIYLLAHTSETGPTWLEVIAHGSGAFFIACGLYMIGSSIVAANGR